MTGIKGKFFAYNGVTGNQTDNILETVKVNQTELKEDERMSVQRLDIVFTGPAPIGIKINDNTIFQPLRLALDGNYYLTLTDYNIHITGLYADTNAINYYITGVYN